MKTILALSICVSLVGCVTTKTANPDGSTTTVTRQDPKVIKELEPIIQVGVEAGVNAAVNALNNQGK